MAEVRNFNFLDTTSKTLMNFPSSLDCEERSPGPYPQGPPLPTEYSTHARPYLVVREAIVDPCPSRSSPAAQIGD